MSSHFRPYEGSRPYLFVSYAHRDSERVVPAIRILHDRLWRIWYDEGIPAGSDWTLNIAQHMDGCAAVLLFLSESAMASPNCTSEIRTACRQGKPLLCVALDDCEPAGEWDALLAHATRIDAAATPADQANVISSCGALTDDFLGSAEERRREQRREASGSAWTVATLLAGALLACSLVALGLVATGRIGPQPAQDAPALEQPEEPVQQAVDLSQYGDLFASTLSFPDAQQERAVRAATGERAGAVPSERLLDITELYLCGNLTPASLDALSFDENGACLVNGVAVPQGQVVDLSLIARMPYLERLALVLQPVEDISALASLTQLRELSLAGGAVSDLSPLAELPVLDTLHLEHSSARDLTALAGAPALARVTVSADMAPLVLDPTAAYDVVLVR